LGLTRVSLDNINLDLIPIYGMHENYAPRLEQILKPEIVNIKQSRFIPRPHPPISKKKINNLSSLVKTR